MKKLALFILLLIPISVFSQTTDQLITIAGIRALSGTLPTNWFYTTNPGQEGHWYYDSTDTASPDNLGTVLLTLDGKRIKRVITDHIDIKWFGAISDGNPSSFTGSDNTAFIQNAINYAIGKGVPLQINGSFLINPIHITGNGLTINMTEGSYLIAPTTLGLFDQLVTVSTNSNNITINATGAFIISPTFSSCNHGGDTCEQRHLVVIGGASNVTINGLSTIGGGGDGFYIGNSVSPFPSNIVLNFCSTDNARRNGISIINGANVVLNHPTCKNAIGTKPKAGIDIEPNPDSTSAPLSGIRIFSPVTSGNGGDGIQVSVGPFVKFKEKTLDVQIFNHYSFGDGLDGVYGGFAVVGNGYSYQWAHKLRGQIIYSKGVIINAGGSGFYFNSMDPSYSPLVKADMYVQDAGQLGTTNIDLSGATIFSGTGAIFPNGNIDLNIAVRDTRSTPKHYTGVYFYNSVQPINNVNIALDWDSRSTAAAPYGFIQGSNNAVTGTVSYINKPIFINTSSISASTLINTTGGIVGMNNGGSVTLPPYAQVEGQVFTVKNGSSASVEIIPNTGETLPTSLSNPSASTLLTNLNDSISLKSTVRGWQIVGKQYRDRIKFTNSQGKKDKFSSTAIPTDGTWNVGDVIENTAAAPGQAASWYNTTAGTPGTFYPFGFVRPYLAGGFTQGDFTTTLQAGYRLYQSSGSITSNMTITLSNTGCTEGNMIKILRNDAGAGNISIVNQPNSAVLYTLTANSSVELTYVPSSTSWVVTDHSSQFVNTVGAGHASASGSSLTGSLIPGAIVSNVISSGSGFPGTSGVSRTYNGTTFDRTYSIFKGTGSGTLYYQTYNSSGVAGGWLPFATANGGSFLAFRTTTASTTILATDYTIDITSGTFTQALPTSVAGQVYAIKNSGAGVITVTAPGNIDGLISVTLNTNDKLMVQGTGSGYIILSR